MKEYHIPYFALIQRPSIAICNSNNEAHTITLEFYEFSTGGLERTEEVDLEPQAGWTAVIDSGSSSQRLRILGPENLLIQFVTNSGGVFSMQRAYAD
jgi:hypothetical protein